MGRSQLLVVILGLGLLAGAAGAAPASGGTIQPATRSTFVTGEPPRPERQRVPETGRLDGQSFFIDGVEAPRPELLRVLEAGRRDGLTEFEAIDRWLASQSGVAPHLDNLDDAEIQDLRTYAEQSGQSVSSVVGQHGSQEEFQATSWHLEELFPDSYAGMRYSDQGATAWMGFNGNVPPDALALIRGLPGDVIVEVGDLLPKTKWQQTVNAAHRAVSAVAGPSAVGFDVRRQQLVVAVPASAPISDDSVVAAVRDAVPGVAVVVRRPLAFEDTTDSAAVTTDSAVVAPVRMWGDYGLEVWTTP
jgi:hypothetical protein